MWHMWTVLLRTLNLLLILQLMLCNSLYSSRRHKRYHKHFNLTLSVHNRNVTEAKFFRLIGVENTVDFILAPGDIFTQSYEVKHKGFWVLFVEFPGNRYSKSPRKTISRDSHKHWIIEVYYYPDAVGFSDWHEVRGDKLLSSIH